MEDEPKQQTKKIKIFEPKDEPNSKFDLLHLDNLKQKETSIDLNLKMIQIEDKLAAIKSSISTNEKLSELDMIKQDLQATNEKNIDLNKLILKLKDENAKLKTDLDLERNSSMENFRKFASINSEINLNLKNENTKLNCELNELNGKLNEKNSKLTQIEIDVNKLKEENEFYKAESAKAFSYAAFYVKKLKEFETLLLKERNERNAFSLPVDDTINLEFQNHMYPLSDTRFVKIEKFNGAYMVNIREYFSQNGQRFPSKKGISLSIEQFDCLKKYIAKIDYDLKKLK